MVVRRVFSQIGKKLTIENIVVGRVAEWFKAAVLKTARGFTLPRGFESHPFRQIHFEIIIENAEIYVSSIPTLRCRPRNPAGPCRSQN
jgi:hypothetical protein